MYVVSVSEIRCALTIILRTPKLGVMLVCVLSLVGGLRRLCCKEQENNRLHGNQKLKPPEKTILENRFLKRIKQL